MGLVAPEELETPLRTNLRVIFSLPPAGEVSDPLPADLGLDVYVPSFQSGDAPASRLQTLAFSILDFSVAS